MTARLTAAAVLACCVLLPAQAFAWGASGHRMIGELGIKALPDDLPAFLRTPQVVTTVGELAREPDRWRGAGAAHDSERDNAHFLDLGDDLTVGGGPSLKALPPTREDYDSAIRAAGLAAALRFSTTDASHHPTQYGFGYLPYSIADGWQQLARDFIYWRIDAAGETLARTDAQRAWFAADRALHEQLAIHDLGVWAHYVGDASQPLHVSVHYGEWGAYPNPKGFKPASGLHSRFESAFVHANIHEDDIAPLMAKPHSCGCTVRDDVMPEIAGYLATSNSFVVPLFELDAKHAFDAGDPDGKAFAAARLAAGASELRDMVVDAWRASERMTVGYKVKFGVVKADKDTIEVTADTVDRVQTELGGGD